MSTNLQTPLAPGAIILAFGDEVLNSLHGLFTASFARREPSERRYIFGIEVGINTLIQFALTKIEAARLVERLDAWIHEDDHLGEYIDFEEIEPGPAQNQCSCNYCAQ